jgi:cytochrome o ubiquinol oxidase subunit 2
MNKKSRLMVGVGVALAALLVIGWYLHRTTVAVLDPKGPIGRQEYHLILLTLLLSLIVVVPVFSLLFLFTWRYREGKQAHYSPDLDHSRVAETIWWLIPSALILVLGIIIWNSSHQLDPSKALASSTKPLTIQVVALDWKWLFIYPQQNMATVNFVQFPAQTPVDFQITADAPMNSFWIPQLGGQIYAMPGMSTELHLLANKPGNFRGSSANISGQGFAGMRFIARSSSAGDFDQWVKKVKQSPSHLTMNSYKQLAQASQNNPVSYYSSGPSGLYDSVITKYIGPLSSMQGMGMQ